MDVDFQSNKFGSNPHFWTGFMMILSRRPTRIRIIHLMSLLALTPWAACCNLTGQDSSESERGVLANARPFRDDQDAEYWMRNMVGYHHFSIEEIESATGLPRTRITDLRNKLKESGKLEPHFPDKNLTMLPYPGGRHPRIGFLDGAIRPQRETKVSVFLPWDHTSYVVLDVPEAIWSNLGLTYLAHTHVPTVFDKQKLKLEKLEWDRSRADRLTLNRRLPNGIVFESTVRNCGDHLRMKMRLTNGTANKLSDLRVQNCVMLKGAKGFNQQSNENKQFIGPYVVCHDRTKQRWIITAWKPNFRPWANPPCPCLHSDPKFPDCDPGKSVTVFGWLSFYTGKNIQSEIDRIEKLGWWRPKK